MHNNHSKLIHCALFLASVFLTACGGGGGGAAGGTTPATTYSIGGTVNGLTGTGLVLLNNGGNLSISANGSFAFATPQSSGSTYNVTVQTHPTGQTCTVNAPSGTVSTANVTTVAVTCAASANVYTIGGTVTGLTGTGLVLQNNGGGNLSISANGSFAFATPQSSSSTYNVTVQTHPTGQTCAVNAPGGTVSGANVTTVSVTCTASTNSYTVGGNVSGLVGTVVLQDLGGSGDIVSVTTNGSFVLPTPHPSTSSYFYWVDVKTQPGGQTCTPTNNLGTLTGNVTTVAVTCATKTYTIGGTISGLTTATGLVLQNNGGNNLTVDGPATTFTFGTAIASGTAYNVTVFASPAGLTCTANTNTGTVSTADITSVSVTCSTASYTIGGTVTGLNGSGLVLQNNGGDALSVTSSTYIFATPLASGSTYNVTVKTQPPSPAQVCTVANASGIITADVTADVTCVNAYTIGGTISGDPAVAASGIGPILQNNGGDNLFIPTLPGSGVPVAFTFSTPIADGAAYAVTQRVRARTPSQDCSAITTGSGNVSGGPVSVAITCVLSTIVPKFAYVTNSTANLAFGVADTVSSFTIAAGGDLAVTTPATTASGDKPYAVAVDPTGQFAYLVNSNDHSISAYSIDPISGVLAAIDANGAVSGVQQTIPTGDNPVSIAIHPLGEFAYVLNQGNGAASNPTGNSISAYSINMTSGALTSINADAAASGVQPIATGVFPYAVTVDPLGRFVYVANDTSNNISAYTVNQSSGALTAVAGSPFAAGTNPRSIAINPTGKCALVASAGSDNINSYMIDSVTGALTPVSTISTGSAPRSVAIDPNTGLYAYVANAGPGPGPGSVSGFSLDVSTCVIASIDTDTATGGIQTTIAAGLVPISINVDPSGQFVYVANFGSNNVSVYGIGVGGALTAVAGSPFATGSGPTSITTTQ